MKGILIGGTHSGCGKTTVTLAVVAGLRQKGYVVQSFKAGPDYIDSGLHSLITGRNSVNLDLWMMSGPERLRWSFHKAASGADIAVIEGVMGLFDGDSATARVAEVLKVPVVLVVDAGSMAESAAAMVLGYRQYYHRVFGKHTPGIQAVILNKIGSEKHLQMIKEALQDVPIIGYIPKEEAIRIKERHLGLITADERPLSAEQAGLLAELAVRHIDLEALLTIASSNTETDTQAIVSIDSTTLKGLRIAYARDRAFCFYYHDNLELLRLAGAELIAFSPLHDKAPPEADFYYFGGGYPELYARTLAANTSMLKAVREISETGLPVYAECGGFMYLCKGLTDLQGEFIPMVGVFNFIAEMTPKSMALGYREVNLNQDTPIGNSGTTIRGHEFHYSRITGTDERVANVYTTTNKWGQKVPAGGFLYKNTLGSYVHLHFLSNPEVILKTILTTSGVR